MSNAIPLNTKTITFIFLLLAELLSVSSAQIPALPTGQIIDSVWCENAPDQSYALYLPTAYTQTKAWPILYFFEPMARGRLPLQLYAGLAEKHGYILICSNNSRNGPMDKSLPVYHAIKSDSESKLSIASDRIYLSGFSGGARLAQYISDSDESITGVVTVAGPKFGEDPTTNRLQKECLYFGIVGNRDMNYIEHKTYQKKLNALDVKNVLLTYPSGHQWAPSEYFDMAINWLDIQYSIKHENENSALEIKKFISKALIYMDTAGAMDYTDQLSYLTSIRQSLLPKENNLLNQRQQTLANDKRALKSITKEERALERETKYYETIYNALYQLKLSAYNSNQPLDSSTYSMVWWQQQIGSLQSKAKRADKKGDAAARTLDVIRGQVFGINLQENAKNNLTFKLYLSQIQCLLYPTSVWVLWNQALIFAERAEREPAIECLKKANQIDHRRLQSIQRDQVELASTYPFLF